ncbi:unnamed protein product [Ectocarpus sp. CCAP 1310/34]|nr:unnamed protein product [Ectocarpus sp. CCAP 1310/34]
MNGLETAAGAIFVELIRQQAERPVSPADSTISSWMPGQDMGRQRQRHPAAMRVDPPMAQYEPFRRTYVSDPSCVPQLRFANVPDAGADHDKREASRHWRRSGRTWSRVPRFRKGETAFTHDPTYKPPHAVVDKWYMTEAGPKVSLAGRVEESRWQSCHSMQSGREPRKPTRSRLPQDQQVKPRPPGPASYHMRDPWEVREVCGAVPNSRVFCKPVRRVLPQTSAFTVAPSGSCDMSVDTSAAPPPPAAAAPAAAAPAAAAAGDDENSAFRLDEPQARPATAGVAATVSSATASTGSARDLPLHSRRVSRTQKRSARFGGGVGRPGTKTSPGRHQSGINLLPHAAAAVRAARARPTAAVGPSSFARAERPHIADEGRRKEESYGKKVVRLLTGDGDVLVTVTRRRASAWGDVDPPPDSAAGSSKSGAVVAGPRAAITIDRERQAGGDENGRRRAAAAAAAGAAGWGRNASGGRKTSGGGSGWDALPNTNAIRKRQPTAHGVHPPATRESSLESRARGLLPDDVMASPPVYREPGKSELPVIFRATSAPIVRAVPSLRPAERLRWGRAAAPANQRGAISSPDGNESRNAVSLEEGGWRQELGEEGAAHMARAVRSAGNIVAKSSGRSFSGGGGGGDVEPSKSGVRTRIPAPSGQDSGQNLAGGDDSAEMPQTGLNDGSCDFVSSTIWSGGETAEVSAPVEAR